MINSEALQRTYDNVRSKWDPHFEWLVNETAPWAPLQKPLDQIALALVSTCGAYRKEIDCPFDAANYYGDPSFKEIPITPLRRFWILLIPTMIIPMSPRIPMLPFHCPISRSLLLAGMLADWLIQRSASPDFYPNPGSYCKRLHRQPPTG